MMTVDTRIGTILLSLRDIPARLLARTSTCRNLSSVTWLVDLLVWTEPDGIRPRKTADQVRLRDDGLRVHFLARLCTA
jgi:hypothetical protein